MQFKPTIKGFERYESMSLFSSRFYKYLTKYFKVVAQKKQFTRKFYSNNKFYNDLYIMHREVSSPIIFDPPFLTYSSLLLQPLI